MIFLQMVASMAVLVAIVVGLSLLVGYLCDRVKVWHKVLGQLSQLKAERPNLPFRVLFCLGFVQASKLKV